jgi:carbon-monoxide dehydrogenase medium subunit
MSSPQFEYYRASSLDEALSLLSEHNGAKVLAGGHSLLPAMKLRVSDPGVLIDIGRVGDLSGISKSKGSVRIGALTTHAAIAASADVPAGLAEAAGMVGDPQVRNRGTIGGNVAHADPASDLPTVLAALGATFHAKGSKGERSISAEEFFTGLFETALAEGEILTAVEVPVEGKDTGSAYAKMASPGSRYAMVGAAATVSVKAGKCESASVAVGGLTPTAVRASSVEKALVGNKLDAETIAAAAEAVQNDLGDDILGDMHASADYRKAMAPVYVRRAIAAAAERAS